MMANLGYKDLITIYNNDTLPDDLLTRVRYIIINECFNGGNQQVLDTITALINQDPGEIYYFFEMADTRKKEGNKHYLVAPEVWGLLFQTSLQREDKSLLSALLELFSTGSVKEMVAIIVENQTYILKEHDVSNGLASDVASLIEMCTIAFNHVLGNFEKEVLGEESEEENSIYNPDLYELD